MGAVNVPVIFISLALIDPLIVKFELILVDVPIPIFPFVDMNKWGFVILELEPAFKMIFDCEWIKKLFAYEEFNVDVVEPPTPINAFEFKLLLNLIFTFEKAEEFVNVIISFVFEIKLVIVPANIPVEVILATFIEGLLTKLEAPTAFEFKFK